MKAFALTNKGYKDFTDNLLSSIEINNIQLDIEIGVMDSYSESYYSKAGYKTKRLSKEEDSQFLKQDSENFGNYMLNKLSFINSYLHEEKTVIYLDGDIVIKKNFLKYIEKLDQSFDLLIQNDKNPKKPEVEYLCAGFMIIKSNKKTKNFFNPENIPKEQILSGLHDQGYINMNKNKLNYQILPLNDFPNGPHYYKNFNEINPFIIHFNYVVGKKKKKLMKKHKEWYL